MKRVVVQALIARAVELAAPASSAGITITVDAPPQDLVVIADGARLEQVLLNIIQNAVEALTPSGGGNLVLRARRQPRAVVIEVEDDGPGLSSPDAPVFDAFFSTKPAGTVSASRSRIASSPTTAGPSTSTAGRATHASA